MILVAGTGAHATRGTGGAPSGTLAFGTGRYVFAVRADGTQGHALVLGDYPAFARSGAALAFTRNGVWVANADGTRARRVVPRFAEYLTYADPTWSPDGHRVAYVRIDNGHGTSELWAVRSDGSGLHGFSTVHVAQSASWSPDGRWVAYVGDDGLSEVGAAGGRRRLLLARPVVSPAWSPDGAAIAYEEQDGARASTWLLTVRGGTRRRLEQHPGAAGPLAWSPDGRWLAVAAEQPGAGGSFVRLEAVRVSDGARVAITSSYVQQLDGLTWRR